MRSLHRRLLKATLVIAAVAGPVPVWAQAVPEGNLWRQGTTFGVFAGAAAGQSNTGGLVGGAVGWEISPIVGLEGRVSWLDRRHGADAFAASLTVAGTWANPAALKPFVEAGVGLYRTSFDLSRGAIPDFYRRRMMNTGLAGAFEPGTFTDPSFILGGGANVFLGRHVAVRPAANVTFVRRDSSGFALATAQVHLVYHFEDHPVTPR